jgi:hypothetical protein
MAFSTDVFCALDCDFSEMPQKVRSWPRWKHIVPRVVASLQEEPRASEEAPVLTAEPDEASKLVQESSEPSPLKTAPSNVSLQGNLRCVKHLRRRSAYSLPASSAVKSGGGSPTRGGRQRRVKRGGGGPLLTSCVASPPLRLSTRRRASVHG